MLEEDFGQVPAVLPSPAGTPPIACCIACLSMNQSPHWSLQHNCRLQGVTRALEARNSLLLPSQFLQIFAPTYAGFFSMFDLPTGQQVAIPLKDNSGAKCNATGLMFQ